MSLFSLFDGGVPIAKLRQEIFALGGRHQGDPLAGALRELEDLQLSTERRNLLQAVVAHLSPGRVQAPAAEPRTAWAWPFSLMDSLYLTVFIVSATWTAVILRSLLT